MNGNINSARKLADDNKKKQDELLSLTNQQYLYNLKEEQKEIKSDAYNNKNIELAEKSYKLNSKMYVVAIFAMVFSFIGAFTVMKQFISWVFSLIMNKNA